ncbi:MAG: hypothetical protein GX965_11155 [Methanoculleus bourgensis]|jgi:hypothetical protein|uniref:hypothetical protein n=1 Tax=Methanoculleus bourgensis TaxID=83986 RepID=UPI0007BCD53C|nr:hypothetical protein [Methanoculleus bourgensis]SAI87531.1 hypothetical protein MBBA_0653 [Methanoculleus bourgensis]
MQENGEKERDRYIFDLVRSRCSEEFDRVKSLDNKASRIIAISGIVLSLETSFVSVLFNNIPRGSNYYVASRLLLITSFIFLLASVAISLKAYAIKTLKTVPDVEHLINEYARQDKSFQDILIPITLELVDAVEENKLINGRKAEDITYSLYALGLGIFAYFLFVVGLLLV